MQRCKGRKEENKGNEKKLIKRRMQKKGLYIGVWLVICDLRTKRLCRKHYSQIANRMPEPTLNDLLVCTWLLGHLTAPPGLIISDILSPWFVPPGLHQGLVIAPFLRNFKTDVLCVRVPEG